MAYTLK